MEWINVKDRLPKETEQEISREKADKLIEALEFYADWKNTWMNGNDEDMSQIELDAGSVAINALREYRGNE